MRELVELGVAPAERFRTIPLGLDLKATAARAVAPGAGQALRAELGLERDDVVLAFVGRLAPIKRVDLLIAAFARARAEVPAARLLIVGDGDERPALEALARASAAATAIRFAGYRDDPAEVFAAADAAVLSSDNEGTPVSLIEAGACGLPAVATDVGGVAEVLGSDCGLLAPAGDAAALGSALVRIAADGKLRRRLGERARTRMPERYGAARLLADIDALYSELLGAA